jgi:hypothetical protein
MAVAPKLRVIKDVTELAACAPTFTGMVMLLAAPGANENEADAAQVAVCPGGAVHVQPLPEGAVEENASAGPITEVRVIAIPLTADAPVLVTVAVNVAVPPDWTGAADEVRVRLNEGAVEIWMVSLALAVKAVPPAGVNVALGMLTIGAVALATTENGMVTAGSVAPAPGDAVTVQVTVWPDTPQLQNGPVGVPSVRFLSSVSATTKLPESALDPELLTVSVITPLEPDATTPPTAPPLGVWVAVSVIAAAAEITMRSLVVAVAVAPEPLKLAVGALRI